MKKIYVNELNESNFFDFVIDDVIINKQVYTICKDEKCEIPSMVMMPIGAYKELIDFDDGK